MTGRCTACEKAEEEEGYSHRINMIKEGRDQAAAWLDGQSTSRPNDLFVSKWLGTEPASLSDLILRERWIEQLSEEIKREHYATLRRDKRCGTREGADADALCLRSQESLATQSMKSNPWETRTELTSHAEIDQK